MKVKNWKAHQHYKRINPPWIKVHRALLDDFDWHLLPGDSAKVLIMLWLVAAEDKKLEGNLPNFDTLCFRFRMNAKELNKHLAILSEWIEMDDSELLAICKQNSTPETETETEKRKKTVRKRNEYPEDFEKLWKLYPGTTGSKKEAYKEYKKSSIKADEMAVAIQNQMEFKNKQAKAGIFVSSWPHLCRWIKHERWNDRIVIEENSNGKINRIPVEIVDTNGKTRYTSITEEQLREMKSKGYKEIDPGKLVKENRPEDSGVRKL